MSEISTTTDQPPPADAPYVFKRYLDGGGVIYEVRQQGDVRSVHPDVRSAQEAMSSRTEMPETARQDIREALLAARGFVNWPAGVGPMQRVLALIDKALSHVS